MKVYLFQEVFYEALGPMYLSAVLKKEGHDVEIIIPSEDKDWIKKNSDAGIIGFSCMISNLNWSLKMSKKIKEIYKHIPIIFGGPHPTIFPEIIKRDEIDYLAIGEAEYSFLELVINLENNKDTKRIKGIWAKIEGKIYKNSIPKLTCNLDSLPFPDRELYYNKYKILKDFPLKWFMVSRGCPYRCNYCSNHMFLNLFNGEGKYLRRRSVRNVIDEIKQVKKR